MMRLVKITMMFRITLGLGQVTPFMDGPIQAICTGQVTEDIFILFLLKEKSFFCLQVLIFRGQDVTYNLIMFGSDEEILEQEETLRKMTQLARAHFPDDDAQSDIFYPISELHDRGTQSQFYPGGQLNRPQGTSDIYEVPSISRQSEGPPVLSPPQDPSFVKRQKSCCSWGLSKTCFPLYVGYSGIGLSLIGLIAYAIVQIPSIRQNFGPFYDVNVTDTLASTESDLFGPNYQLYYGLEVAFVTSGFLIGITINLLLVYGVMTERRYFLLPWLLFHALVVVALVIVFIIVIVLGQPIEHRWWALVPLFFGLYLVYAWIKLVDFYFVTLKKKQYQRNLIIQSHFR